LGEEAEIPTNGIEKRPKKFLVGGFQKEKAINWKTETI